MTESKMNQESGDLGSCFGLLFLLWNTSFLLTLESTRITPQKNSPILLTNLIGKRLTQCSFTLLYWMTIFICFIVQTRLIAVLVTSVLGFCYAKYMELGVSIRKSFQWCGEDCNDDRFKQLPLRFMRNILGNESVVDPDLAAQRREFRDTWNNLILKSLFKDHQIDKEEKSKLAMGDGDGYDQWESKEAMIPQLKTEEAKRRLEFFIRSANFCAKRPLKVRNMPYFTVLVPHYEDPIAISGKDLRNPNKEILQIFRYYRKENEILEKSLTDKTHEEEKKEYKDFASMRSQSLSLSTGQ